MHATPVQTGAAPDPRAAPPDAAGDSPTPVGGGGGDGGQGRQPGSIQRGGRPDHGHPAGPGNAAELSLIHI
eukprot:3153817-Lingulodinium_polyedra.AAC.1